MPAGRPSLYSEELAERICEKIADGVSLKDICEEDWAPSRTAVFRWLNVHPEFANSYASAREAQAELLAEEIKAISDDGRRDYKTDADGNEVPDHDHIARSKLRVDTRKWIASKLKPKVYGDRQQLDINGTLTISEASEEDLLAELTELVTTGVLKLPAPAAEPDPNEDLL